MASPYRPAMRNSDRPDRPASMCGAKTKICGTCGHHLKCHKAEGRRCTGKYAGRRTDPCKRAIVDSLACETFTSKSCESKLLLPNGRCRRHFGNIPTGMAHPAYEGKGYSKFMPDNLIAQYEIVANDDEWLSLRNEIDLLRTQVMKLVSDLRDASIVPETIHAATKQARRQFRAAMATHHQMHDADEAELNTLVRQLGTQMTAMGDALETLKESLSPAAKQDAFRRRTVQLTVAIEKLNRTETRNRFVERGMLTLEQVVLRDDALIHAWKEALHAKVLDDALRTAILAEVGNLYNTIVGRPSAPALNPSREAEIVLDAEHSEAGD